MQLRAPDLSHPYARVNTDCIHADLTADRFRIHRSLDVSTLTATLSLTDSFGEANSVA